MSLLAELARIIPEASCRLNSDVLMSERTTFRIGGPADILFEPNSDEEITRIVQYCRAKGIAVTVIGNGSNILVSDKGIRGVVLLIGDNFSGIDHHGDMLVVRAGTKLSAVAAYAAQRGLAGLEFASGIPGTLGGAILMNAGAYDHCMSEIILLTEYLDDDLKLRSLVKIEHEFGYRKSKFSDGDRIIIRANLQLGHDVQQAIYDRMADLAAKRRASQPLDLPSAGSAFKRPAGYYAGKLISDCGLKGYMIGDAQVSEKHAGFIVNRGRACATDIRELFKRVQEVVHKQTGVYLEPEVRFVGEW
jgi:UDP-N-acetylmuramate dehydrogenase